MTISKSILGVETTGFAIETAAGIAVITLAIIGLAGGGGGVLIAVTAIVLGGALFVQGLAVASEYSNLVRMLTNKEGSTAIGGGMTVEMLAGAGVVVLGILGLLGFFPRILLSVSVIAAGAALVLSSGGLGRLNSLKVEATGGSDFRQKLAEGSASGAIAAQVLAGCAGVVLGILALTISGQAAILALIGFLVLGAAMALNGAAFTGKMVQLFTSG